MSGVDGGSHAGLSRESDAGLLFDLAVDMMCVIDGKGRFIDVNEAWTDCLGYDREAFVGQPYRDFVHPDDLVSTAGADAASRRSGVDRFINRYRHSDGHYVYLQWRAIEVDGLLYAIARDITDALAEEAQLRASEIAHRLLFDVTRQGVMYHDGHGVVTDVNSAALKALGAVATDVVGTRLDALPWQWLDEAGRTLAVEEYPPSVALRRREAVRDAVVGVQVPGEGETRWLEMDCVPVFDDDATEPTRLYTTFLDITAERSARALAEDVLADLRERSRSDGLTGLRTREVLMSWTAEALAASNRDDPRTVALLYCDMDNFKYINDAFSHAAGDALLVEVARRIAASIGPLDIAARVGGDEFVVGLGNVADVESTVATAERLRHSVSDQPFVLDGRRVRMSLSAGIALSNDVSDPDTLLREADTALRHAKERGRDRVQVFGGQLRVDQARSQRLATLISVCLVEDRVRPWHQPILDLTSRTVVGHEALAALHPAGQAPLPASVWIDVAEDRGLMPRLGSSMLQQSLATLAAGPADLWLTVNAAGSELADPGFADHVLGLLGRYRLAPQRLKIEVAEPVLVQSGQAVNDMLARLADAGVGLILDRFGAGSASLTTLRDLPLSGLKLDRAFVHEMADDQQHTAHLAAGLADVCHRLGLLTIAEGIETAEHETSAFAAGWTHGQGFYFDQFTAR